MECVTNGALIEITAEENEERALEALEAAVADLASTMKDLRRATDRFGASLSTAVSKTKQISSSMVELRNSLHSLEQTTTRLVNPSLPVAPSTMASHHRHVPLPVIPSITGSIPPSSSSPSTMASHPSVSLPAISSITESLPPSVGFSTTKLLRTSFTESLPVLTRIEKPEPQLSPDFQFEELHTTASRQKLPIKCFNPIRVFITMDWRVPIASSSLTNPPHCKMPYLEDREGVQAESATGVASLQTSFGAMWQIAWADSYGRNGEHCLLFSWACQCAPGVAIIPVVRCFYIYGVLLFWVSVFLRIISAQNWWCLHEEYPFLYIMVLSLKAKSRRYFPDFGGISCEPCAYTKTTLERGQLKLTTAYGFGGSSMTSIDRVGGDDRLKVSRLEGFVSNREQSYEDPIEELLYAVFGVVSENATVAKLAATSQADLSQLQAAASFACQLEWAVKLIDPASVLQDSNVHGSLNINLSDDEDGSQASVSSANMSTEGNSVQQDYSGMENILYLGGPNIAFQIYNKECANVRIRGAENWGSPLANFLRQPHFIVWNNSDLITHEVMGGLKNAYATGAGTVAAFTNESATSKSDYFDHCTSDMIFITHLVAEDPAKLARPLLADTYVTLLKGRNAGYGQRLAKGELNLGMDDCINGKGQGMIQGIYEEGCNQMCLGPFTSTPIGSPCGCVLPMKVRLLLSVAVYALFPEVNELEIEVATGTYLKHSQLKIVGATANSQNQERPIVGLNLVSLGENFDNTTATLIFERLLRKEVPLNTTLFGIYEVIYIKYPGILSSLPSGGYIGRGPSGSFGTRTQATKNDFDALIGGVADSSAQEAVKRIIEMTDRAAMRKEVLHTDLITPLILKESMLVMKKIGDAKVIARGGYPQAERCRRSVGHPEATIDVSDVVAAFSVAGNFVFQPFYHGIFLGSLLGTGIAREKLRAIIVLGKKGAQVLMVFELADFVIESLYNVGNFSVSCTMIPPRTKTFKTVETSPRIEALASASVKSSRSKIVAMIGKGDVKSDVYSCSVAWVEMRGNEWSFDKCKRQWDPGKYCVALDPDTL